jgi:hypothetical protein
VEIFVFIGVVIAIPIILYWRSRRGISRGVDDPIQSVAHDGRNKFGNASGYVGGFHGAGDGDAGGGGGTG